ncbi:cytochrome P450 [Aspergillus granulosus]|uniref:Cytochrome P450 n=1 Tax=Aspergillus granulosus TaxID=176169 RepID=A0ABR4GYM0_9EURO
MDLLSSMSFFEAFTIASLCVASYAIALMVHRLCLSPISSFPGPFLARITFWYEFYHDWIRTGQYYLEIEKMHRKYGPVVRITPNELHVQDPAFYHELFVTGAVRKTDAYPRFAEGTGFEDMVAVSTTHDMHRATRAPLDPFFSMAGIRRVEPRVVQIIEKFRKKLGAFVNTGKPVNLTHAFGSLTTDVVSCMLFEEPSDYLGDPTFNAEWFNLLKKGVVTIPLLAHMPWLAKVLLAPVLRHISEHMTSWRIWDDKARRQIVKAKLRPADEAKNRSDTTIFDHLVHSDLVESIFGNGGFSRLAQVRILPTMLQCSCHLY